MILVVSHDGDDHLAPVLDHLSRPGCEVVVVDTSRIPAETAVVADYDGDAVSFTIRRADGGRTDLARCGSGWWRRPLPQRLDPRIGDLDEASWAVNECFEAMSGVWDALPLTWVSPPRATERAMMKTWQLAVAPGVGLVTPRTVVTNDPEAARSFVDTVGVGRTVCKAFSATEASWRETRMVGQAELAVIDRVSLAPVIFQEFVPAEVDLRVILVGDEVFAAEVHSQDLDYPLDFRLRLDSVRIRETRLPDEVTDSLRLLLKVAGLRYGAVDMRRTPAGEHVFLEINPAGQWLFVEDATGQPVSAAMAALLRDLDRAGAS
jgi:hypothetical protein